jgi:diguanylate cyclase (GGDEF)-like protein/PAS domain S-box-containing protein
MPDNNPRSDKKYLPLNENDFIKVIESTPDIIFIHVDGIIKFINKAGLKLFGAQSPDMLIGESIWNIYPSDSHGLIRTRIQKLQDTDQIAPFIEFNIKDLNDSTKIVESVNIAISYDSNPAVLVIMRDISINKLNSDLLNMRYAISSNLVANKSLESALTFAIKTISSVIHSDIIRVWLLDNKSNLLNCIASWTDSSFLVKKDIGSILKPNPLGINEGLIGKIFQANEIFWSDIENEIEFDGANYKFKTTIALPIKSDTSTVGVLELNISKIYLKNDLILKALMDTSDQLGIYIKHRLYEKELIYISNHDQVTGLINRYLFEQTLNSEIELATNNDQKLALILIDINDFRLINTRLGHAAGDLLLQKIAQRLLSMGFSIDHTSRIENDKFAIIIHDAKNVTSITDRIIDINNILSDKYQLLDETANISINIGISIFPDDGANVLELMRSADIALIIALEKGNGAFQFSALELTDKAKQKMSMENSIRYALSNNEFHLFYQPIVDCRNMTTVGFEALLRWNKGGTFVPTDVFIPILEKTGMFAIIGEWILRTACQQCKEWQKQQGKPVYVSVNLSMIEFQNTNLLSVLKNTLLDSDLDANSLTIEITESTLMQDKQIGNQIANEIKNLGVRIAIDDFGSGYSSLNYLAHVPMNFIKLDKLFIDEICTDPKVEAIVQAAILLGKSLNYQAIAEGVETKEQLEILMAMKCPYIQGFYFSKPMSASDATDFLKQHTLNMGR